MYIDFGVCYTLENRGFNDDKLADAKDDVPSNQFQSDTIIKAAL
mgnify:CR=1 FL=1|jgi:hypothetical protein